jgi:nucleotide-binding universal stress UspA family protein
MKVEKILACVDLGPDTDVITRYASHFAKAKKASINLLYVIDYLTTPPAYLAPYIEEEKKTAEKKLESLKKRVAGNDIETAAGVVVGRLNESIGTVMKKINADMLVLGFRSHALRRSSSEKLIKGLQIPMLVVKGEKTEAAKTGTVNIKKILCPVDFSEISGNALKTAMALGNIFNATLDVLHIFPSYKIQEIGSPDDRDRAMKEMLENAKGRLDGFLGDAGIAEPGIIEKGEPYKEIVSFSKGNDIDLIVMGARGLGLIKGMLIGSVTDAILKSSPCPILVIH